MGANKLFELATNLRKVATNIKKEVAITALNHYKDKFLEGNGKWDGVKWEDPQRKTYEPILRQQSSKKGAPKRPKYLKGYTKRDKTRATLVGKGVLSRSIKYRIEASRIVFYSNVPYAKTHNDGEKAGKGAGFMMPKRTFLGMEKPLEIKIENIIKKNLNTL